MTPISWEVVEKVCKKYLDNPQKVCYTEKRNREESGMTKAKINKGQAYPLPPGGNPMNQPGAMIDSGPPTIAPPPMSWFSDSFLEGGNLAKPSVPKKETVFHAHDLWTYLRCHQKFAYNVLREWETVQSSEAIRRGSCMHEMLANHYTVHFLSERSKYDPYDGRYSDENVGDMAADCAKVFQWWFDNEMPKEDVKEVLAVEGERQYRYDSKKVTYLYRPDLLYRTSSGDLVIRDWKTVSSMPGDIGEARNFDPQMLTYSFFIYRQFGEVPKFEYVYIKRQMPKLAKTPVFLCPPPMQRSEDELELWGHELNRLTDKMLAEKTVRNHEHSISGSGGDSCALCPFVNVCMSEMFKGEELSEDLIKMMGFKKTERGGDDAKKVGTAAEWNPY